MGDIYNQDTQLMKAYGSFEIQIDYYELMYEAKKKIKDLLKELGKKNSLTYKNKDAWPQPSEKPYHEYHYDELIDDFHKDYVGPFDATFRSKLADYEDTIKELISIEQGGNYFEPPKILGRESFYQDIKNDALLEITVKFEDTSTSTAAGSGFDLIAWIVYHSFTDPQSDTAPFLFNKFLDIVAYKYKGDLQGFIDAAGDTWNADAVRDFFLDNNPTYKNMVTCGGNPKEQYHGLDAGYAIAESDDITLNDCTT